MKQLKILGLLCLIGLVVLFVVQNAQVLNVDFLVWSFEIRRALLIFIVLVIGIILGWFLRFEQTRRR